MVDAFEAEGNFAPDYVSVYEDASQQVVYTTPLTRDSVPDLVLFDRVE